MTPTTPYEPSGSWDSIHVFETAERGRQAHYKLTSTVMLQLVTRRGPDNEVSGGERKPYSRETEKNGQDNWKREGEVSLSGSMTRQTEQDWPLQDSSTHITNTGKMIEEMEIKMRNLLQEVGFTHVPGWVNQSLTTTLWIRCTLGKRAILFTIYVA
jgi:capping protein beta